MADDSARYDLLIVPSHRKFRMSEGAFAALVRWVATGRSAVPYAEALAETWTEVYMEPGPSQHDPFVKGSWSDDRKVFVEAVARHGELPASPGYGALTDGVHFFLEFQGCLFDTVTGRFRQKIEEIIMARVDLFRRPHEAPRPHREVPEGQERKGKKRREIGPGLAGTRVEEL